MIEQHPHMQTRSSNNHLWNCCCWWYIVIFMHNTSHCEYVDLAITAVVQSIHHINTSETSYNRDLVYRGKWWLTIYMHSWMSISSSGIVVVMYVLHLQQLYHCNTPCQNQYQAGWMSWQGKGVIQEIELCIYSASSLEISMQMYICRRQSCQLLLVHLFKCICCILDYKNSTTLCKSGEILSTFYDVGFLYTFTTLLIFFQ